MTDVLLFHHAQGLTDGIRAFADDLRAAGHVVTLPDLFDGHTFATVAEGVAHVEEVGFDDLVAAGVGAADGLPDELVYAGFSFGVLPAQRLAQQRPGALGALLYHSGVPVSAFGDHWPPGVPLQVHVMADDELGEVELARDLVDEAGGELYLYEGSAHLFTDRSLDDFDPDSAALVLARTLAFLEGIQGAR